MIYCPYLDDKCPGAKPDCVNCLYAIGIDEVPDDEEDEFHQYDPFDDIEDVAYFINFLDEHNNDFIPDEDLFP